MYEGKIRDKVKLSAVFVMRHPPNVTVFLVQNEHKICS